MDLDKAGEFRDDMSRSLGSALRAEAYGMLDPGTPEYFEGKALRDRFGYLADKTLGLRQSGRAAVESTTAGSLCVLPELVVSGRGELYGPLRLSLLFTLKPEATVSRISAIWSADVLEEPAGAILNREENVAKQKRDFSGLLADYKLRYTEDVFLEWCLQEWRDKPAHRAEVTSRLNNLADSIEDYSRVFGAEDGELGVRALARRLLRRRVADRPDKIEDALKAIGV